MNYNEIKTYDCGKRGNPRFVNQQKIAAFKPLLTDMITAVEHFVSTNNYPPIFYNIETKCTPDGDNIFHPSPEIFAQLLYDVLLSKSINQRCYVQSFDLRTLRYLKQQNANVKLVLLVENHDGFETNISKLGFLPEVYSPMQQLVSEELVNQCHYKNIELIPWTVNETEQMLRFKKMGVDGLITDYPDVAIRLLNEL